MMLPDQEGTSGLLLRYDDQAINKSRSSRKLSRPFCLTGPFFGQTSNNIIELGKMLDMLRREGENRRLGLDEEWSAFYQMNFDMRDDVLLHYYKDDETSSISCEKVYDARKAFYSQDWNLTHLINLLPSAKIQKTADEIMSTWPPGKDYISVHRRELNGWCHLFAKCSKVRHSNCTRVRDKRQTCSTDLRLKACDIQYEMVPNPDELPVALFTDGQAPTKDATFPYIFKNSDVDILVEMWLMTKSKKHWGNPRSTLDIVVSSWRRGLGMAPEKCYRPNEIVYEP